MQMEEDKKFSILGDDDEDDEMLLNDSTFDEDAFTYHEESSAI